MSMYAASVIATLCVSGSIPRGVNAVYAAFVLHFWVAVWSGSSTNFMHSKSIALAAGFCAAVAVGKERDGVSTAFLVADFSHGVWGSVSNDPYVAGWWIAFQFVISCFLVYNDTGFWRRVRSLRK